MTKNILRLTLVLIGGLAIGTGRPVAAQNQALKLGYTDHELIIANMPQYRDLQARLQQEYDAGQKELQGMMQDYQDKLDKYQKQQALLSPERRQEREKELQTLQTQLQQAASVKEQGLAKRQEELLSPLLQRVQAAIDSVAVQKGLDLVLRSQVGVQPVILYRNEKTVIDITEDVARGLGLNVAPDTATTTSR